MDKRNILLATATAALAVCAVVIATMEPPKAEAPEDTRPPVQITDPAGQETDAQDKPTASDLWSDDGSLRRKVLTYNNMSRTVGSSWATHSRIGAKDQVEYLRPNLQKLTFDISLDFTYGVDPRAIIERMEMAAELEAHQRRGGMGKDLQQRGLDQRKVEHIYGGIPVTRKEGNNGPFKY